MNRFQALAKMLGIAAEDVAKLSPEVINTLEKINTPEISTALKGAERDQYLKALDSTYGDRTKRASDLGFGDETFYHGTKSDISEFDKSKLGSSTGAKSARRGFFFSDDPSLAADYAELAPPKTKALYDPRYKEAEARKASPAEMGRIIEDINTHGEQVIPVKLNTKGSVQHDFKGNEYRDKGFADILDQANGQGAVLQNAVDPVYTYNSKPSTIAAVQDPSKIRSVNAAFDPRFKDSAKIMAGAGAIPTMDFNPINQLGEIAEPVISRYEKIKSMFTGPLSKELNLSKDPEVANNIKAALDIGADPVNFIPGGAGLAVGAAQMLGTKKKKAGEE